MHSNAILLLVAIVLVCSSISVFSDSDYKIIEQYSNSCNFDISYAKEAIDNTSTYFQRATTAKLLGSSMVDSTGRSFDAHAFLELIRNKNIAVVGDSVMLQMFNALENDLLCEQTLKHNGNETFDFVPKASDPKYNSKKMWPGKNHWFAAVRKYARYNVTMIWCVDNLLTNYKEQQMFEYCGQRAFQSDIILIGVGAHFKPLYRNKNVVNLTYYEDMDAQGKLLDTAMRAYSHGIRTINPKAQVYWSSYPHVADHDEKVHFGKLRGDPKEYRGEAHSSFHSDIKKEAYWVPVYNVLMEATAKVLGDEYLEWNALSHMILKHYVSTRSIHPHFDATHWVAGGFRRLALLKLYDRLLATLHP